MMPLKEVLVTLVPFQKKTVWKLALMFLGEAFDALLITLSNPHQSQICGQSEIGIKPRASKWQNRPISDEK